jgi:hypothetical protein
MLIFHNWKQIHYEELENKNGWFRHKECKKCGKNIIMSKLKFFSSFNDAIDLGIIIGIYRGFFQVLHSEITINE